MRNLLNRLLEKMLRAPRRGTGAGDSSRFVRAALVLTALHPLAAAGAGAAGLRAPPGFEITRFAGDDLAHDIFAMTVDARGDIVVAGPGYVKILRDQDGDGVADGATLFSPLPRTGAQGLYFDGNDLLATGDGAILRLRDPDGNGVADGPPETLRRNMATSEHGTHAVIRGPDGWFYVMCGNSPLPGAFDVNSPGSPVKEARQGTLLRFSPDFRTTEAVIHGFRNSYDFAFLPTGQILVYDSDGERAVQLPGYAPTRVYDAAIGEHHGWMLNGGGRAWIRPEYFPDSVERCVELGRGSPTGVLVYRHRQFPERYRQGVFMACWSLGTIYFVPLAPRGASFEGAQEKFVVTVGSEGFAPVDLEVGPTGDLFVAIGGRGTQGGVFRIRYTGESPVVPAPGSELAQVLAADQPLSSWSRAKWIPLAEKLGAAPFGAAAADRTLGAMERIRAVEILVELFGGVDATVATGIASTRDAPVVARLAWALARGTAQAENHALLAQLAAHADVRVQRAAWEGLLSLPPLPGAVIAAADWVRGLGSADRRVRRAAILAAQVHGRGVDVAADSNRQLALAALWVRQSEAGQPAWMRRALALFRAASDPATRLEAVRLLQIGLGDINVTDVQDECDLGYAAVALGKIDPVIRTEIAKAISDGFPYKHPMLDFEAARLFGLLQTDLPPILPAVASFLTENSAPEDDLHFLLIAAQLPGPRSQEVTARTARAFALQHGKIDQRQGLPDRLWQVRMTALLQRLGRLDPRFAPALVRDPAFGHPGHALFVPTLAAPTREAAARKLLAAAEGSASPAAWSPEFVETIGLALPPGEALTRLRARGDDPRLRDAVTMVIVSRGDPADRERLIAALAVSAQATLVEKIATALATRPASSIGEIGAVLKALSRHGGTPSTALALDRLLAAWTDREPVSKSRGVTQNLFPPWFAWFSTAHPAEAAGLAEYGGTDVPAWLKRLGIVEWHRGDAQRGAVIYEQRGCVACHQGGGRLGPSLAGIASRFSRDDLFLHIIDPNLSISPTYRAQQILLKDGTSLVGLPVYQSPAAVLLETSPGTTVRIVGAQIASVTPVRRSPMPEGLLAGIDERELADFYAYLQTLAANPTTPASP